MFNRITCQVCKAMVHAIKPHLDKEHPDWTIARYQAEYPDAPLLSELAKQRLAERKAKSALTEAKKPESEAPSAPGVTKRFLHELFDIGDMPAAKSRRGDPIPVTVFTECEFPQYVPQKDPTYVFNIDNLKTLMMCLEMGMPAYVWGHMGTGKTTLIEQMFAYTNRPLIRIQHTINTEEAHILGQWVYRNGETRFQPGWLPLAMRYGWGYLADEYDFAAPHVLSVYQPVLEGKRLVIKEADEEWRVVDPHPNFRFFATGNTNGVGDETGLYQGTQIQNAANYERFAVVMKVDFMDPEVEKTILMTRAKLAARDAENMVSFAKTVREQNDITMPISPRSLVNAARLGTFKGDFRVGLQLAYINRLPAVERETANQIAQRIFG